MGCAEFSVQLATFRELSPDERARLQAHLEVCPDCAATLAAYMEQDRLLSALPTLRPSAKFTAAILSRTVRRPLSSRLPAWRWASVSLAILVALLAIMGTAIGAAAEALPGDLLYPVKRVVEEVRLSLTFDPAARENYEQLLAMTRLEEAQKVLEQGREADIEFQGTLEAVEEGEWSVSGIKVQIAPDAWEAAPPEPGTVVRVEGRASGGRFGARRVSLVLSKATPTREASPIPSLTPSPTATPTGKRVSPTPEPSATWTLLRPSPSLGSISEATRPSRLTWTPRIVPTSTKKPTWTPQQPTTEPSATHDGSTRSTPKARRTPPARPTMRPSRTPHVPPPTPERTFTPTVSQVAPSRTPHGPIHTPKPSATPRRPEPTRTPIHSLPTATLIQDQPWPSNTPVPPTPTPQPTATAIPSTPTPPCPTSTPEPLPTPTCPRCHTVTPEGGHKRT